MAKEANAQERILNGASLEFAEKGFAGARMDSISKRANVNKAMIHYYYSNKEQLYSQILELIFEKPGPINEFMVDIAGRNLSNREKIAAFIYFIVLSNLEILNPVNHRILAWEFADGGKFLKNVIPNTLMPRLVSLVGLINKGVEEGDFNLQSSLELIIWNMASTIMFFGQNKMIVGKVYENAPDELSFMLGLKNSSPFDLYSLVIRNLFINLGCDNEQVQNFQLPISLQQSIEDFANKIRRKNRGIHSCSQIS